MTMLLIDAGNSRLKWALAKFKKGLQTGAWSNQNVLNNEQVTREIFAGLSPPDHVVISNVAGEKMTKILQDACAAWSCNIKFVVTQQQQCGVLNTYQRPAQLGSDRWAALIAAWQQQRNACLIINCGTATTVDTLVIDRNSSGGGIFLGGLILPGVEMMQRSLTHCPLVGQRTAQLIEASGSLHDFPQNTADAIYSGAMRATLGAIQQQYAMLVKYIDGQTNHADGIENHPKRAAQHSPPRCLLSGGAAYLIQPHLANLAAVHDPDLVLRGLQIIGQDWMAS
ncbi:MAG: type III pantothenate kinase [Candidatus Nitrotoga sp.]